MPFSISSSTLQQLDWPALCERLAGHCAGSEAREYWLSPPFLQDRAAVEQALARVGEAQRLLEQGETPPLQGFYDLRPHLGRLQLQAGLEGAELLEAAATLGCIRRMHGFLATHRDTAPLLAELAEQLVPLRSLEESIEEAFDASGKLADNASAELAALRRRVLALHETLTSSMQALVSELDRQGYLQDSWYTLRQERYVVPLRAGARGHVRGIVHDVSNSGQTLFIEPEETVELNNRLRIAQLEAAEEERRILARLSSWLGEELATIAGSLEGLVLCDRIFAAAALARELQATVPAISDGTIELRRARHPLLVLAAQRAAAGEMPREERAPRTVVANDLLLDAESRVLVVSGPNTGGKTVMLKLVGLAALMLRAGLPLPADPGSSFPLFDAVFADIGDQQSIARSLSTFSAHLTNLTGFLPLVDRHSLVLLDELAVGTDPREGEALASAILSWLAERGAWTFVTTHYEGLKALALDDPRFTNASMGYDPRTLAPTFKLYLGQPGRSSPLDIAARLGLPDAVLERARSLLPQANLHLERALRELEESRAALEEERSRLARATQQAELAARAAAEQEAVWQKRRQALVQAGREEVLEGLRAARAELSAAVRRLQQGEVTHEVVRRVRREVEGIAERAEGLVRGAAGQDATDRAPRLAAEDIRPGLAVLLPDKGLRGVVEAVDSERGQATVRAGALRIAVPWAELCRDRGGPGRPAGVAVTRGSSRRHAGGGGTAAVRPVRQAAPVVAAGGAVEDEHLLQTPGNSCDLRGLRADEALAEVERFMDRCLARHDPYVFLIHGHGTGALKTAVRQYLDESVYVGRWRPGHRGEGGDGVTVVWLDRA